VNPLLWLAGLLDARGHRVEFLLTPHYGHLADRRGFAWHPVGTEEEFLQTARDPALWKPGTGTWRVARAMHESLPACQAAFEASGGEFDLVVTSTLGLAASALAERRNIPRLMLHLQPMCLRSHGDLPVIAGWSWLARTPAPFQDAFFFAVDGILNRTMLPPLNRFREGLGLPRLRDFYRDALMRADGLAVLSPDWFAPPQPDWPKGLRQFDFPPAGRAELPPDLRRWIDAGEPPVLWTHGSANVHLTKFQKLAADVTALVGGRALLVGKAAPDFPLPDGIHYYSHVAFEDVFPCCRAAVHHGGIGTTSKAFAAGIPQLVIPLAHDQHDNAARVERLKAGLEGRLCVREASRKLRVLFSSQEIASGVGRCLELSARSLERAPTLADWAEELAG